jgi:hypothetical protein
VWQVRDAFVFGAVRRGICELTRQGRLRPWARRPEHDLAANAIGVGSCPATLHFEDQVRDLLEVPSDRSCRFAIGFGSPDETTERGLRQRMKGVFGEGRKAVTKIVRFETFR